MPALDRPLQALLKRPQHNKVPVLLQVYERALPYFELAAAIQPQEVKWSLMVASCYRRIGAYDQALTKYVEGQRHPQNEAPTIVCMLVGRSAG
jgi:tetratricopeptide (TPR) repeat protein